MQTPEVGNILIAPPGMVDERFNHTVLLLTHNVAGGSFALCLNKLTPYTISDISKELKLDRELKFPLYWGGPVQQSSIWMLHSSDWHSKDTNVINDEWSVTSSEEMFYHIADGDTPNYFRFVHGFCSWGPGQLKSEIAGNPPWTPKSSWLVAENPGVEWLLECPENDLWQHATDLATHQAVDSWL